MTNEHLKTAILSQKPTEQQKEAIFSDDLEFLLRAAPGSGKTWTSCRRFIWRGANWNYSAGGLALLSFTNVAISEFKQAANVVGCGNLLTDPNYVGTFDSFIERYIISPFGHILTKKVKRPSLFIAPRPGDRNNNNLRVWINGPGGRKQPIPAWDIIPFPENGKTVFQYKKKNLPIEARKAIHSFLSLGYYTHAHRAYWSCLLLNKRPHLAKLLARRFPEIIVDEAQDSNAWLLILLNFLRKNGSKITLVGDPNQCIYEFSMADATSLPNLKARWSIPEKPLSKSFRCRNPIADAVRNIGGNRAFSGCGDPEQEGHGAYLVKEDKDGPVSVIDKFTLLLERSGIKSESAAIICRAHNQLESLRGVANYSSLKGKTRDLATAAFLRDTRHDYSSAFKTVYRIVKELTGNDALWDMIDENPGGEESMIVSLAIWRYVKSPKLLPTVFENGIDWITHVRDGLNKLIEEIGITVKVNLGHNIKKTGLKDDQMPLFTAHSESPKIRQDTIHQVKGESIDAVMAVGSTKFWNSVVKAVQDNTNSENRRLAYVAMTRARHVLVVSLPGTHFDKHAKTWKKWGFSIL